MSDLSLNFREYGAESRGSMPVLLLHGLFGSLVNWHGIARRLGQDRRVLVPDLRNHGESPWAESMSYPGMASDLVALLAERAIERAHWVGHSMGGKAAMWLALVEPGRVGSLVVVDTAPVPYASRFGALVRALVSLPLDEIVDRSDADRRLALSIPAAAVRGYLLQNLTRGADGGWRWRFNLPVLAASMDAVLGFPDVAGRQFPGSSLFLYGSRSDYVTREGLTRIRERFPPARLRSIPNAGHWVYADQPEAFIAAVSGFLSD